MQRLITCGVIVALLRPANGLQFGATGRRGTPTAALARRQGPISLEPAVGIVPALDEDNYYYYVDLIIGSDTYEMILDAGSADLSIGGPVPLANDTGIPPSQRIIELNVTGQVSFTDVSFAGYNISQMIFAHLSGNDTFGKLASSNVLGLLPSTESYLYTQYQHLVQNGTFTSKANSASGGEALVDRIFLQNSSLPKYTSFSLGRQLNESDPTTATRGNFTIGEIVSGYENITSMPKLPTFESPIFTLLDGITVNGVNVSLSSSNVSGAPSGKLVASLDCGQTSALVSASVAEAIYRTVPGAALSNTTMPAVPDQFWSIPCNAQLNVSFVFGGVEYPIHPLDLNFDSLSAYRTASNDTCYGGFFPLPTPVIQYSFGEVDMILGNAFLRNVYTLLNYGNSSKATPAVNSPPYIQLLSTTDPATAASEFAAARQNNGTSGGGSSNSTGSGSSSSTRSQAEQLSLLIAMVLSGAVAIHLA